jgi:mannan endo-1,4-beta-mannosidase
MYLPPLTAQVLIDQEATIETKNLYQNLFKLQEKKALLFGHQDALAYGVTWKDVPNRSDVKDVVGDYPAVFGWDIGGIEHQRPQNIDQVSFAKMKSFIVDRFEAGAINTISWHMDNPQSLGNSWDTTTAVASIIPGGKNHQLYVQWLDRAADFLKELKTKEGVYAPILFRPFHEHNGGWFWWGNPHCSPDDYIKLWKFTVDYLKNKKNIHHLIYVYNTNNFQSEEEFIHRYPGNDYADVMSFDTYQFAKPSPSKAELEQSKKDFKALLGNNLTVLQQYAQKNQKPMALAETGFETIPDPTWWTQTLYASVQDFDICYVLIWRNHGLKKEENQMHYYAPYKGHPSSSDFKNFYALPNVYFGKKTKVLNLYK